MSKCTIDHTLNDVRDKLENQKPFLPKELVTKLQGLLEQPQAQNALNNIFHLLKKYDLATETERERRNKEIKQL